MLSYLITNSNASHTNCRIQESSNTHTPTIWLGEVVGIRLDRTLTCPKSVSTIVLGIHLLLCLLLLWERLSLHYWTILGEATFLLWLSMTETIIRCHAAGIDLCKVHLSYTHLSILVLWLIGRHFIAVLHWLARIRHHLRLLIQLRLWRSIDILVLKETMACNWGWRSLLLLRENLGRWHILNLNVCCYAIITSWSKLLFLLALIRIRGKVPVVVLIGLRIGILSVRESCPEL